MEKICLEIENVELTFLDKTILEIERLAVHQFDRIGIVGENGAGKSTLLKLMAGVIQPSNGHDQTFIDRVADCVYDIEDKKLFLK